MNEVTIILLLAGIGIGVIGAAMVIAFGLIAEAVWEKWHRKS